MSEQNPTSSKPVIVLSFLLSLLGSFPLASALVDAIVEARLVSRFEGASGMVAAMSIPPIFLFLLAIWWGDYFMLRRFPTVIYVLTACLAAASISTLSFIAGLL